MRSDGLLGHDPEPSASSSRATGKLMPPVSMSSCTSRLRGTAMVFSAKGNATNPDFTTAPTGLPEITQGLRFAPPNRGYFIGPIRMLYLIAGNIICTASFALRSTAELLPGK